MRPCVSVCVCVCVCVPRTPHGDLSDTSALEISSGGGSGLNSLPVWIQTGVRTLRSPVVLHCPAEIHKALPEIYVIWRGAYVAQKPLYTFQHS